MTLARVVKHACAVIVWSCLSATSSFSQEVPGGWGPVHLGMGKKQAIDALNQHCEVKYSKDFGAEGCGEFFGQPVSIQLHFEGNTFGLSEKVSSIGLFFGTSDRLHAKIEKHLDDRWKKSREDFCLIKREERFRCLSTYANGKVKLYKNLSNGRLSNDLWYRQ